MRSRTLRRFLGIALLLLGTSPASAQLFRAYLSIDGSDANPCTLTQPCRLLPAAIAAVASGGEIWMLDSANYNTGPVNIDKPMTILAVPGALGSVVALGGNAIEIVTTGVYVTLRNLSIVPFPGNLSTTGVFVNATAATLLLQDCNVSGFIGGFGVRALGANRFAVVVDSVFHNNQRAVAYEEGARGTISGSHFSDGGYAVHVLSMTAQTSRAAVSRSTATRLSYGFVVEALATGSARAELAVIDSTLDLIGSTGIWAHTSALATALVSVSGTQISHSNVAIVAENPGARVYARNNHVSQNDFGFVNSSAVFNSGGDNGVFDNGSNTQGSIVPVPGT